MTNITAQDRRVQYPGNNPANAGPFTFNFQVNATSEIKVYVDSTLKTLTTHYTVSLSADGTGSISFTAGNFPTNTQTITIMSNIPISRTSQFTISGANFILPAKASRLGKLLGFNSSTGNPEVSFSVADGQTLLGITADIATLADLQDGTTTTNGLSTLAGIASNITTVANISSNVTSVAGVASLITADFVSDLNTLAQTDIINDLNTLATADIVSDLNTLATTDIVNDLNKLATDDIVSDLNTLATTDIVNDLNALATTDFVSDLNAIEAIKTNVTTVANNISDVNTFANRYRIGSADPTSSNDAGDLFFNTSDNTFKFFNGSSYAAVNVSGIANIVEDTTPQLGGNLDGQDKNITTTGLISIGTIEGAADGNLKVKTNSSNHAIAIEENSGSEAYAIGVEADGALGFYNSGSTTPVFKIDDTPGLELLSTTASTAAGPIITLKRDRDNAQANDLIGRIIFEGSRLNSSSQTDYARIFGKINDSHSQNGEFHVDVSYGGSLQNRAIFGHNAVIFNEDGYSHADFRIESDNNANMFVLDASADQVSIADIDFTAGNIKTNSDALSIDIDADGTYSSSGDKYFSLKFGGTPVFAVEDDDIYVRDNITAGRILPSGGGTLEYITSHSQVNAYSAGATDGSTHINRTYMSSRDDSSDADYAVFQAHTLAVRNETNHTSSTMNQLSTAHLMDQIGRQWSWGSQYAGRVKIGTNASTTAYRATDSSHVAYSNTGGTSGESSNNGHTAITGRESANGDDVFIVRVAGSDRIEFDADGNGHFDGGADISAADYAEYFEWADGNPKKEDRRGYPVALTTGGKIKIATSSDDASDFIGIVSVEAAVVGDSAWSHWTGMHERDKFGQQIREDYELLCWGEYDEDTKAYAVQTTRQKMIDAGREKDIPKDAKTVTKSRLKYASDYDPSKTYIPRKDRPEWQAIGLMGKLPLLKGQPTAPQWKKLFDLNSEVEMWLVR